MLDYLVNENTDICNPRKLSLWILQNHLIRKEYHFIFPSELYRSVGFISTLQIVGIIFIKKNLLFGKILNILKKVYPSQLGYVPTQFGVESVQL